MPKPIIELKNAILPMEPLPDPIDLAINHGKILIIHGPSGGGKTTLIKTMTGLVDLISGRARLFGHDMAQLRLAELSELRRKIAVVFEGDGLISSWTVYENMVFPFLYHDLISKQYIDDIVQGLLAKIEGRQNIRDTMVADLHNSQRRQVSLVRALYSNPEILFVDSVIPMHRPSALIVDFVNRMVESNKSALVVHAKASAIKYFPGNRTSVAYLSGGTLQIHNPKQIDT